MWRFIITLLAALMLSTSPAQSEPVAPPAPVDAATVQAPVIAGSSMEECQSSASAAQDTTLAQASCCSGKGGFCGCSGGKVRCCNGGEAAQCPCRANTSAAAAVELHE